MSRYYASQALRNPKIQRKAIDYALAKATPFIHKTGSETLNQLSTKIRPKKNSNKKDLDGAGIDTHKWIGKFPKPKGGLTPLGYKYMGPYIHLINSSNMILIQVKF